MDLILNSPRWQFRANLANFNNSLPSDSPLKEKCEKTLAFLAVKERQDADRRKAEQMWIRETLSNLNK